MTKNSLFLSKTAAQGSESPIKVILIDYIELTKPSMQFKLIFYKPKEGVKERRDLFTSPFHSFQANVSLKFFLNQCPQLY